MKTRSGREIVGYVVREGKVRGEGRYMGTTQLSEDWKWRLRDVDQYRPTDRKWARRWAKKWGGRVVAIVAKAKPQSLPAEKEHVVEVVNGELRVNGDFVCYPAETTADRLRAALAKGGK